MYVYNLYTSFYTCHEVESLVSSWDVDVLSGRMQLPEVYVQPQNRSDLIYNHWPFQGPKLELHTIYKVCMLGLCKGISLQCMTVYGTVPGPEIPIDIIHHLAF